MSSLPLHSTPAIAQPPAQWERIVAHAVPLLVLPSSLWRLAMTAGIPVGFSADVLKSDYGLPGTGYIVLPLITIGLEALAVLTLGLVNSWGLVAPNWLPFAKGKTIPRLAAVIPAAVGAVILTLVALSQLVAWNTVDDYTLTGVHRTVMGWCYAPMLLWGPFLGLLAISYNRRRRPNKL